MKRFLLIILALSALVTIGCKREKAVVDPSEPIVPVIQVSGEQSGTWSGKIQIVGDVVIPIGETLTINSGTSVVSEGYYEITVLGNLYANGVENSRITFTVADTTGYSNFDDAEAGAWKGLYFQKSGDVELHYCDFSYGKNRVGGDGGVMRISRVNEMEIDNCRFHHNMTRRKGGAVYAENSILNIHDCEVYENQAVACPPDYTWGVGFQFLKCDLDIHDMVFHDNFSETAYGGGMNIDSCNMELRNAVFYDNKCVNAGGLGIQRCKDYTVRVANMLAYNNSVIHYGGGLAMATSDPELNNLTIVHNTCGGGGGGGMQTAFDAAPTLNNCIFWGNYGVYSFNKGDTLQYCFGSQIYLWGSDCKPVFNNGLVQYGFDSIFGHEYMAEEQYNFMLESNPLFVDPESHNYLLNANSPCINTGTADVSGLFVPSTDLSGSSRIVGGRIDMGCYEWQGK